MPKLLGFRVEGLGIECSGMIPIRIICNIRVILGLYGIMEKKMETIGIIGLYRDYKVYLGVILG